MPDHPQSPTGQPCSAYEPVPRSSTSVGPCGDQPSATALSPSAELLVEQQRVGEGLAEPVPGRSTPARRPRRRRSPRRGRGRSGSRRSRRGPGPGRGRSRARPRRGRPGRRRARRPSAGCRHRSGPAGRNRRAARRRSGGAGRRRARRPRRARRSRRRGRSRAARPRPPGATRSGPAGSGGCPRSGPRRCRRSTGRWCARTACWCRERLDGGGDHGAVEGRARRVAGRGGVDGAVDAAELSASQALSVRSPCTAVRRGDLLGGALAADHGRHAVPGPAQLAEHDRPDVPGSPGEKYVHAPILTPRAAGAPGSRGGTGPAADRRARDRLRNEASTRRTRSASAGQVRRRHSSSHSAAPRWPRSPLQRRQAATSFSSQDGPPLTRGTRWSVVAPTWAERPAAPHAGRPVALEHDPQPLGAVQLGCGGRVHDGLHAPRAANPPT